MESNYTREQNVNRYYEDVSRLLKVVFENRKRDKVYYLLLKCYAHTYEFDIIPNLLIMKSQ